MKVSILLVATLSFLLSGPISSHATESDSTFVIHPKPELNVTKRDGAITIDGDLSDAGWAHAAHVTEFAGAMPVAGARPLVPTEAMVTYDEEYFYVAMIGHDPHPEKIRSSLTSRDRIFNDDFMGIILDTYGDATKAFELYVNPRGIEGDLFWTSTNEDDSYDMVYDADARITPDGWQMEMRIPFRSLRFPALQAQNFHITFWRNYPRETIYKFTWAPINFTIPCAFCQLGVLKGIENVHNSGTFELLPSLVTSESATEVTEGGNSHLNDEKVLVRPSLNARLILGTATAIEAAIKPDFSQVESDAAQVSANSTFALFYPERRPFFQDGSDLWNTYLTAVYTRSINSPIAAAKVLHRDASSSVALLSSYDENTPIIIPLEERSIFVFDEHKSLSNIFRATHTFDDDRYLGVLATDRRYYANGSNSVAGIDGRIRLFENVALYGQQLFSYTREPDSAAVNDDARFDDGRHTVEFNSEKFGGNANTFSLERFTPTFDFQVQGYQTSPSFRAGDGFITQNDTRGTSGFFGYKIPLEKQPPLLSWLVEIDGSLVLARDWNYGGTMKHELVRPQIDMTVLGQTDLHLFYESSNERFANTYFGDLHRFSVRGSTRFVKELSMNFRVQTGRSIYYDAASPNVGNSLLLVLSGQLRPLEGLMIEPSYTFSKLDSLSGTGNFFSGSIYWVRTSYQFTKELDLRLVTQYDGFERQLLVDPLLTYRINPFTSFFIGSSHDFLSNENSGLFHATGRQFFAKLQYLIQT